jgi:hypothetical protein
MITFEGAGVITMRRNNYLIAAVFFSVEILGRIIMTVSIFLPRRIQEYLSQIIK